MPRVITNGDMARDTVSGFEGQVMCVSNWLYGCRRLTLYPTGLDEKGQPQNSYTFDEDQLELVKPIKTEGTPTGGPQPEPVQRIDPE
ncbi:hypothetical protein LCGC14_1143480 [marine sediment metagenome]|uniref:Uncharacterized protein n=1 Tax=marine sediment metagenome TaxID=412755 RepID=A0A0F9PFR7_9ZZZZ